MMKNVNGATSQKVALFFLLSLLRVPERLRHSSSGQLLASHRCGPGFEPGSGHVGFCGGQSGAGAGFLRVLRFPLPIRIPPIAPKIILIYHLGFVQ
jgi:hypothetical protein